MRGPDLDAFVVPRAAPAPEGSLQTLEADGGLGVRYPAAAPDWITALADLLRAARAPLAARGVGEIAAALGSVADRLLDPGDALRTEALELLPKASGLSPEMCAAVLDGMAANWLESRLLQLVESDLGDRAALDRFVPAGAVEAMAIGPALTVQIVAGTVPGVGVDALVRSLLVKGPTLLKPGRSDVVLPVLFAKGLAEVDAALSDALAVVYWPGGSTAAERSALARADVVTAYGSDETVRALRDRTPITARFVAYHHRVSVGVVGREALRSEALDAVAMDVAHATAFFDQRGCVSPQVVYVEESGEAGPADFARALARALRTIEERLPGGRLTAPEASALHQIRGTAELMGHGSGVEVHHGGAASWTVLLEQQLGPVVPSVGRALRVRALPDATALPRELQSLGPHLQTVGAAGLGERLVPLAAALGRLGASRVVPFSSVAFPPPWWHHDGRGPLRDLVRWVDLERDGRPGAPIPPGAAAPPSKRPSVDRPGGSPPP